MPDQNPIIPLLQRLADADPERFQIYLNPDGTLHFFDDAEHGRVTNAGELARFTFAIADEFATISPRKKGEESWQVSLLSAAVAVVEIAARVTASKAAIAHLPEANHG